MACAAACALAPPAAAQIVEAVGGRALGMGGAFVAVADDSSATWWNPAGLADGPFLDMSLVRTTTAVDDSLPARRDRGFGLALGTPPLGVSYYRLRATRISTDPIEQEGAGREDRRAGADSLEVSQLGVTFIQTLIPGIHAATTLKYVRGTARHDVLGASTPALMVNDRLDRGDDLAGGRAGNRFDLDVGVLGIVGPLRLGVVGRNLRAPEFGGMRLPRQVRVGAAFDAEVLGRMPWTVALDVDLHAYEAGTGPRRVVAAGVERWFRERRVGVRGGGRFDTAGASDGAATAGASWLVRPGLYVEGHIVGGGAGGDRGWGMAARVSF